MTPPHAVSLRRKPIPLFTDLARARSGRPWPGLAVSYILGAVLFAAYAVSRGQDANWDLQNYHDYDAFALLHWRYGLDVAPGAGQTFLNPLPYVLPYLLRHNVPPLAAAIVLAAVQALVVPLAWALSGFVVDGQDTRIRTTVRALATLTAVTGAMTLSEVGTSFADLLLALLGLASLLAMLCAGAREGKQASRFHLLAGLLAGAAAGLKLTNAVVAVGLLGAAVLPWRGWTRSVKTAGLVALGTVVGAALSDGWWAFYLWHRFGSPIFPFLNTVFRSPSATLHDWSDPRFLPRSIGDALTYPFRIAAGLHPTAENAFQDWRFAMALPLCLAFALLSLAARARHRPLPSSHLALLQASAFLLAGFAAWLFAFAIQRYAITFEVVAGLLTVAIAAAVLPRNWSLPASLLVAVVMLISTRPTDWWHRTWSDAYRPHAPAEVAKAPAAYLLTMPPFGYWAPALPRSSRFYLLEPELVESGGPLARRLSAGLDHPPGGTVWSISYDAPMPPNVRANLASIGFALVPPCYRARSMWWVDTIFCRAEHAGSRPLAAPDLRTEQSVSFSSQGSGWPYELAGWDWPDGDDTWATGSASSLVLKPEATPRQLALDFDVRGLTGPAWPVSEVRVLVPGAPASSWVFRKGESWSVRTLCVPETSMLQDGVLTIAFQALKPHSPRDAGLGPDDRKLSFALRRMALRPVRLGECAG